MTTGLIVLGLLNLFDACATYYFVGVLHVAEEVNPVMAWVISAGWPAFFLFKMLMVAIGGLGIYRLRHRQPAWIVRGALGGLIVFYAAICLWHFFGIYLVVKGAF